MKKILKTIFRKKNQNKKTKFFKTYYGNELDNKIWVKLRVIL